MTLILQRRFSSRHGRVSDAVANQKDRRLMSDAIDISTYLIQPSTRINQMDRIVPIRKTIRSTGGTDVSYRLPLRGTML